MIDFRYHLVSIVSIFLALAVGIVLGAGPLKGQIGDTLNQEVTQLRKDKQALRTQLDGEQRAAKARDAFTTESLGRLVGGRLGAKTVAVVVLPTADSGVVRTSVATLQAAGAKIVSTTTVSDAWITADPAAVTSQEALATRLAQSLGLTTDLRGRELLDRVLASSLTRSRMGATGATAAQKALADLVSARLVDVSDAQVEQAELAVVVGGPVSDGDEAARQAAADRLVSLATSLDATSNGAVLISDIGVSGTTTDATSLVQTARGDSAATKGLSTVDDASLPMGQVSLVYALLQQEGGGVGQYGLDSGATAPYPPVPQ